MDRQGIAIDRQIAACLRPFRAELAATVRLFRELSPRRPKVVATAYRHSGILIFTVANANFGRRWSRQIMSLVFTA
jgi:hypothetical protein